MQNMDWDKLNNYQMGWTAKNYVVEKFTSFGCDIKEPFLDTRYFDFTLRMPAGHLYQVKVSSVRGLNYIFFEKNKFKIKLSHMAVIAIYAQYELPKLYLVPFIVWLEPNSLFVSRDYVGLKSKPEWGISLSEKNLPILEKYNFDEFIDKL